MSPATPTDETFNSFCPFATYPFKVHSPASKQKSKYSLVNVDASTFISQIKLHSCALSLAQLSPCNSCCNAITDIQSIHDYV
ncbi:hypothetical protein L208DRAFT_1498837 [Tricholoma matsutake]|nr:hypothetical protein L208DRAFT_1498837 [Tricholoma matsutake 945]